MRELVIGTLVFVAVFSGGIFAGQHKASLIWHRETVARGLALYCPESGQWAWVGECGE